jgi:pimeloyl-ACP methyl ester carboxylesterase
MPATTPTLVLVHGAWHGAWCWDPVLPGLAASGIPTVAVDLPGHGASVAPLGDLASDAAALRASIDAVGGPVIVVAHSYGGAVASVGAAGCPAVRHLVFVAAFPLAPGESCTSAAIGEVPSGAGESSLRGVLRPSSEGMITLDPEAAVTALYNECSASAAAWAASRLGPQARAELEGTAPEAAWEEIPSTYVVCTRDRAVAPALQRVLAARCTTTIELATDHSPFLSRPTEMVEILAAITRDATRSDTTKG